MKINNTSFNIQNVDEKVELQGWINKKRDLGSILFVDLRDRSGIIQLKITNNLPCYKIVNELKIESVISIKGVIKQREEENPKLKTGQIEVLVSEVEVLNKAEELPFDLNNVTALEDTRLKYRYLDLRNNNLKNNIITKHKIMQSAREYLNNNDFIEIETPILCKSTPEGARDYLVPSRVNKGKFYALPQSPQIFKQLLMSSGFERYYQIARCFRDEDLRADRQPEFTQIDLEMSFVNEEDVMSITEGIFKNVFKKIKNIDLDLPFKRMTYKDAMNLYGSDKPDTRFDMKINDITSIFNKTDFEYYQNIIKNNGIINAIVVKNSSDKYSRKKIDKLNEFVKIYKADFLSYIKYEDKISGSISKYITEDISKKLIKELELEKNDIIFIVAGNYNIVKNSLGALRLNIAKELDIIPKDKYNFLWITDFPMFEYSEDEGRYIAAHHPFTQPQDINKLDDKANALARAYDIVLNGYEVGGGSIRIHDAAMQEKVLKSLGFNKKEAMDKFGFLINALSLGTPPHGGLAIGLERLTMILCKTDNIRDVIAFPKTTSASCLMSDAPNEVLTKQLDDLGIKLK